MSETSGISHYVTKGKAVPGSVGMVAPNHVCKVISLLVVVKTHSPLFCMSRCQDPLTTVLPFLILHF